MNRKDFLKTSILGAGAGAFFQLPFTGQPVPAAAVRESFAEAPASGSYDAIIAGGSFAGLSAAMGLGRCMRTTLVIDSGLPRNRMSPAANNLFSRDGENPREIAATVHEQLRQYQEFLQMKNGEIVSAAKTENGFAVQTADGGQYEARFLVLATGLHDELLTGIEGLEELWGNGIYHCPYCHGWENRNRKTALISQGASRVSMASTLANWTDDITVFTQGERVDFPDEVLEMLHRNGIRLQSETIYRIEGTPGDLQIHTVESAQPHAFETCYAPGTMRHHTKLAEDLGCELSGRGAVQVNDTYETSVPGVLAIGDLCSRSNGQVIHAAYSGTVSAVRVNLAFLQERFS